MQGFKLTGALLLASMTASAQYGVQTIAGNGPNNILGTALPMNSPYGVAYHAASNSLYFSAYYMHRVYKLNVASGVITVAAGFGLPAFSGDGARAQDAGLRNPMGVAVDAAGNLYIADYGNHRIRRVDTAGNILTIAGTGAAGFSGDNGPAAAAQIYNPTSVAVDSAGNIYIGDTTNNRVRKVAAGTAVITTYAGNGGNTHSGESVAATAASISSVGGLAVDAAGNLFISDTDSNRVRRVDAVSKIITTVAGTGNTSPVNDNQPAIAASIYGPRGIAIDSANNIYVAEQYGNRIRKFTVGGTISTYAGGVNVNYSEGAVATASRVYGADGLAFDSAGNLYIATTTDKRVLKVAAGTTILTSVAGTGGNETNVFGDAGPAVDSLFDHPARVTRDAQGNTYITDREGNRVRKITAATGLISTIAGTGTYSYSGDGGLAVGATFRYPTGVAVDSAGNVYVSDYNNHRVRKIAAATGIVTTYAGAATAGFSGEGLTAVGAQMYNPDGLAIDAQGNLYVADYNNHRVRKINGSTGIITTVAGTGNASASGDTGPAIAANVGYPSGVALDTAGNLYITQYHYQRVRKVNLSTGIITTVAGSGTAGFAGDGGQATAARLYYPSGVSVDGLGNLLIADLQNNVIRRVNLATGIITTIAGTGTKTFGGDGGPGNLASFAAPTDVYADGQGNVWVTDTDNGRVRLLTPPCGYSLTSSSLSSAVGGGAGSVTVTVLSGTACTWQALSNASWITVTSGATGSGTQTVTFNVAANSGVARSGTITLAGQTFTVNQAGVGCPATVNPTFVNVGEDGASSTFQLNVTGACAWTGSSNAAWTQIYPLSGTGTLGIQYTVGPNFRTQARVATVTIAGQTFTINQAAGTGVSMRRFIRLLYYFYFGRVPSEAEVNFQLGSGQTRAQLATAFYNSAEFNNGGRFVGGLYVGLLDRDAEYGGWLFQRNAYATNIVTQSSLVQNFITSPEYILKFGNPSVQDYVRLLYRYILLREASPAEVDFQSAELIRTGNRTELARAFLNSGEFQNGSGPRLSTFLLYATLLQRDASAGERSATIGAIQGGTPVPALIEAFLNTPEFNNNVN